MKVEKDILKRIDRKDGMTVPEGYFADFAARMASQLEPTEFEQSESTGFQPAPVSRWHRVRPYVYLAAMFAGVWCMLKMFTMLSGPDTQLQPSQSLADALDNEKFFDHYVIDDIDTRDIVDIMMEDGDFSFDSLDYYDYDPALDLEYGPESLDMPADQAQ